MYMCMYMRKYIKNLRIINKKSHACLVKHESYYEYFAKHKCDFSLFLREQVSFPFKYVSIDFKIVRQKITTIVVQKSHL